MMNEKNVRYVSHMLSFDHGDTRMASFLELNPRGKVPVLKYRDFTLTESNSILLYLEEAFPQNSMLPRNPTRKAVCITRMMETDYLATSISHFTQFTYGTKNKEDHIMEFYSLYIIFAKELLRWNDILQDQCYIMGDQYTLADVSLISILEFAVRLGMDFGAGEGLENIARYYQTLSVRDSVLDTTPPHWKNSPNHQLLLFAQKFFHKKQ
eukprot:TRINITY_DN1244_c0_g1_i1.p1 TRINITY_DN1244_c0_g1~~TRINITY_DN1244_c0_g1_i1.p1  ORF type:complete len:210 (-),score=40.41 TRINITY_DN1244_c0_g1_i1:62-691(-)